MPVICVWGALALLIAARSLASNADYSAALNTAIQEISSKWKEILSQVAVISHNVSDYSDVTGQCGEVKETGDHGRVACNRPAKVKLIYNVKVDSNGITLYYGGASSSSVANGLMHTSLPGIESVYHRTTTTFNLRVRRSKEVFSPDLCSHYVDGTLHVMGRQTTDNVFHALNDNVLPLASQVILDMAMQSGFLTKPRYLLYVGSNSPKAATHDAAQVPHISLLSLLAPGVLPIRASRSALPAPSSSQSTTATASGGWCGARGCG